MLTIRLLGGASLAVGEQAVTDLPTRKAEALLIYLVCHQRPFPRETLAELLWDDRSQEQALANLRSILSSLRHTFKPYLTITRQTVAFNHESDYWLDVVEFEKRLEIGDWRLEPENHQSLIANLQEIASLYQGHFLEGFYLRDCRGFEEWALLERERLGRTAVSLLWQLITLQSDNGDYPVALHHTDQLLRLDDLSERAHRQKMLLLARTGQFNAALQQYDTCCRLLADELGVEPAPETNDLLAQIRAARETPPPKLPPPLPHFVGREAEQSHLLALLRNPACRLITLLGPGGIGKTRLAVETVRQAAAQQPGQFLHGIWFVPLAGVHDVRLLTPIFADVLGITLAGKEDPAQQLAAFVRERELLLVLDNFEQLTIGADLLARLLAEATQIKLLVTSQEPLYLQEEWLVDVGGLAVDEVGSSPASQLFWQIARRLNAQLTTTSEDITAVNHICRLLEGMPLGIELAAAWIRHYSPPQIAAEIAQGLDFLATHMRNTPERHRSLRAVFDYAWQRLTPQEQAVFVRLAVFHGEFSLEAATAIAQTPAIRTHLNTLVEKSLLRRMADRYDLHPILRQYAAEKLAVTSADEQTTRQNHAAYYLDYLIGQGRGEEAEQQRTIQVDLPDIRAAWGWTANQQNYADLLRAAEPLHNFYSVSSKFREGTEAFQDALAQLDGAADNPLLAQTRGDLLGRKARMHIHIGQLETAVRDLDEAISLLRQVDDAARLSTVLGYAAINAFYAGEFERVAALTQESLHLAEAVGDEDGVAFAYNMLGSSAKARGIYAQAIHYFEQAAATYHHLNDQLGEAMALNNLGNVAQAMGDFASAQTYYLTCSRLFLAHNHLHGAATTLANAGRLATRQGELAQAQALLAESLSLKREMGDERGTAVALAGLGDVFLGTGDSTAAQNHLREALALAHKSGDVKLVLEILAAFGVLAQQQQLTDSAALLLAFVTEHKATSQEVRERITKVRENVGETAVAKAQSQAAQHSLDSIVKVVLAKW